jgi:chromate transporter
MSEPSPVVDAGTVDAGPAPVPFREALKFWLKLGLISFGGPAGQIAIMHEELVEKRRWISERRFLHALNYCMVLPGPEAQQLATYIGWLMHRTVGGVVAGGLFVLPSLLLFLLLGWIYMVFGQVPAVAAVLYGIKPAVVALVLFAAVRVGRKALGNNALRLVALLAFLAIAFLNMGFPWIVGLAALLGWAGGRWRPELFRAGGHGAARQGYGRALIDDHTPIPDHARFRKGRFARVLLAGAGLWAGPLLALGLGFGWQAVYTRMALFFSKAALLTFGGAYAVLPYVVQGAVLDQHWLSAPQMMDGLALGETTPGPLIMVVAFVGFVGGWLHGLLASPLASAALAAVVVTWVTFLPSFIFILLGGPLVEASREEARLVAPLTAITAAVVGVILNLALFFALHVFWPAGAVGRWSGLDGAAVLLAVAGFGALYRYNLGVPTLIGLSAVAGLLLKLLAGIV